MWTDFDESNQEAMRNALGAMNDFRQILTKNGQFELKFSQMFRMN